MVKDRNFGNDHNILYIDFYLYCFTLEAYMLLSYF